MCVRVATIVLHMVAARRTFIPKNFMPVSAGVGGAASPALLNKPQHRQDLQSLSSPQLALDARRVHTTGYLQLVPGPLQSPTPTPGAAQPARQLPSQSIAQSGAAQRDRSSPATSQPAGSVQPPRRPPPGFGSRSGNPDAGASPSLAGSQRTSSSAAASPYMQPPHHGDDLQRVRRELAALRNDVAALTQATPDGQPQAPSSRIMQKSASSANAAASRPAASVPYYMPAQQVSLHSTSDVQEI